MSVKSHLGVCKGSCLIEVVYLQQDYNLHLSELYIEAAPTSKRQDMCRTRRRLSFLYSAPSSTPIFLTER